MTSRVRRQAGMPIEAGVIGLRSTSARRVPGTTVVEVEFGWDQRTDGAGIDRPVEEEEVVPAHVDGGVHGAIIVVIDTRIQQRWQQVPRAEVKRMPNRLRIDWVL